MRKHFNKGNRVESLVEPVGEKGTVNEVFDINSSDYKLMDILWDNTWRNAKISISHDATFTNDNGTEIFKLIK
jgi:hypothetical protein